MALALAPTAFDGNGLSKMNLVFTKLLFVGVDHLCKTTFLCWHDKKLSKCKGNCVKEKQKFDYKLQISQIDKIIPT